MPMGSFQRSLGQGWHWGGTCLKPVGSCRRGWTSNGPTVACKTQKQATDTPAWGKASTMRGWAGGLGACETLKWHKNSHRPACGLPMMLAGHQHESSWWGRFLPSGAAQHGWGWNRTFSYPFHSFLKTWYFQSCWGISKQPWHWNGPPGQ